MTNTYKAAKSALETRARTITRTTIGYPDAKGRYKTVHSGTDPFCYAEIDLGSGYQPFRLVTPALLSPAPSLHQDEKVVLKRLDDALRILRTPFPEPTEWIER